MYGVGFDKVCRPYLLRNNLKLFSESKTEEEEKEVI